MHVLSSRLTFYNILIHDVNNIEIWVDKGQIAGSWGSILILGIIVDQWVLFLGWPRWCCCHPAIKIVAARSAPKRKTNDSAPSLSAAFLGPWLVTTPQHSKRNSASYLFCACAKSLRIIYMISFSSQSWFKISKHWGPYGH